MRLPLKATFLASVSCGHGRRRLATVALTLMAVAVVVAPILRAAEPVGAGIVVVWTDSAGVTRAEMCQTAEAAARFIEAHEATGEGSLVGIWALGPRYDVVRALTESGTDAPPVWRCKLVRVEE